MFKDTQEGQTHYENDGCGEPAHNMNPITKAHLEGVEMFEKVFPLETNQKTTYRDELNPEQVIENGHRQLRNRLKFEMQSFLTTYGTNLLTAAKEAGPEGQEYCCPDVACTDHSFIHGHNDCRSSFISAIDEGIKEITKGKK